MAVAVAVVVTAGCGSDGGSGADGGVRSGGGPGRVDLPGGGSVEVVITEEGFQPPGLPADVVPNPSGCAIAVGTWDALRGGTEAGWWSSGDCIHFTGRGPSTAEPEGDALPSDDKTALTGLAGRPSGDFIAVGYREERADDAASDVNVHVIDAAGTLRRVAAPEASAVRAHQAAHDVIVTQAGTVVVVGVDGAIGGSGAMVWRSPDLATAGIPVDEWEEVPAAWEPVALPPPSADVAYAEPAEILQTGDGRLVIVGSAGRTHDAREVDPAAWVSMDDGRTWIPAGPVGAFGPEGPQRRLDGVAEVGGGGGLVAVGRYGDGGCLWRSTDGLTWSEAAFEGQGACGQGWTADVVAGEQGVLVVGSSEPVGPPEQDDDRHGVAWYSANAADTAEWTRLDLPPGVAHGAFPTPTGFVILGGVDGSITWAAQLRIAP